MIERLKRFCTVNNVKQKELADYLGVTKGYMSSVFNGRDRLSTSKLTKLLQNNMGWDVSMFDDMGNNGITCKPEKQLIPFYDDIATIGGRNESGAIMEISQNHVSEWIDAGDWFPEATAAIRHYGDSMTEYPSGSILALKRVHDTRLIINGRNYVIETTEFRVTKQLQDDGGDYIMAYSSNRETYPDGRQIHSPIRIPKDTIRSIDLVLGCVLKEYSNGALTIRK